jgi:hypothetical protein
MQRLAIIDQCSRHPAGAAGGSVDHIIPPGELRPFIIGALERRLATGAELALTDLPIDTGSVD